MSGEVCSDDDLEKIKQDILRDHRIDLESANRFIALIARLEAAELGAELFSQEHKHSAIVRNWFARMGRDYEAWLKVVQK